MRKKKRKKRSGTKRNEKKIIFLFFQHFIDSSIDWSHDVCFQFWFLFSFFVVVAVYIATADVVFYLNCFSAKL